MVIQVSQLTKRYGDTVAVDGLDLTVNPGEIFGFLGPNGAGKTTTIKMMTGLLVPTSGSVEIGGIDMAADPVGAKRLLAYVPDTPDLYEKLTATEFLRFAAQLRSTDPEWASSRAVELLELFELEDRAGELIGSYSHGMRQKVCIAAALLANPKVLFLDEPTVGLDPKSARVLKDLLRGLADRGTTVFMSTHILEIAERMCDRVGIIQSGRLIAMGSLEELRKRAKIDGDLQVDDRKSLEDLFLELTGGNEYSDVLRYLEGK